MKMMKVGDAEARLNGRYVTLSLRLACWSTRYFRSDSLLVITLLLLHILESQKIDFCPPPLFLAIPRPLTLRSRSDSVKTFLHCERPYGPSHRVFSQAETSDCNCSRLDSFENEISASSIIVSRPQPVSLSSLFSRSDKSPSSDRARD